MPKPKALDTLELCQKELDSLEEKRKYVMNRKSEIESADNARLGALVRKEFRNLLPVKKGEQREFFKELRVMYESRVKSVKETANNQVSDDKTEGAAIASETESAEKAAVGDDDISIRISGEESSVSAESNTDCVSVNPEQSEV